MNANYIYSIPAKLSSIQQNSNGTNQVQAQQNSTKLGEWAHKTYSFEFNKFIGFESKQNSSDTNPVPAQKTQLISANAHTQTNEFTQIQNLTS